MSDLPSNLMAEQGLLGVILNSNASLFEVGNLSASDFSETWNGELFLLLKDMIEGGKQVNAASILHDAQDAVIWGDIKASEYLASLENDAPSPERVVQLAKTIQDTALKARIITAAREIERRTFAAPPSIPGWELREELDEAISSLFPSVSDMGLRKSVDIGDEILDRLKRSDEDHPIGLPLGLKQLQDLTGPLLPGRLYIIAAGSGVGKSSILGQVAHHIAQQGKSIAIFSAEMPGEEVVERLLAAQTDIPASRIERAHVNNDEFEVLFKANDSGRSGRLYIDDHTNPSVSKIRTLAMRQKRLEGLDAVFVDQVIHIESPSRNLDVHTSLDQNLQRLKSAAKELEIPIVGTIVLSAEATRDLSKWPHRRPNKGDILYAGNIDRHSDVVVIVHRREYFLLGNEPDKTDKLYPDWLNKCDEERGRAEFILTKRRGGEGSGRRSVGWDKDRTKFLDSPPRLRDDLLNHAA